MDKGMVKVFKFTFKNQISPMGYKMLTGVVAAILFLLPIAVFLIVGSASDDGEHEKKLKKCGADIIYVVNSQAPDADLNSLNDIGIKGYTKIKYISAKTVEEALENIRNNGEKTSFVLQIDREDDRLYTRIIVPESASEIEEKIDNYEGFIEEAGNAFTVIASGVSVEELNQVMMNSDCLVYDREGYQKGEDLYSNEEISSDKMNEAIRPIFNIVLLFVTVLVIYMTVILYGNSITQSVIEEKTSKLMDTMLISIEPKSLIFGKMLAILTSGLIQFALWIVALVAGLITGIIVSDNMFKDVDVSAVTFVKSFQEMKMFEPVNILIGILALIFGIVLYASLAAMCGTISSTREEAASNNMIFTFLLLGSFYIILFKGFNTENVANFLYLFPFTSVMVLPAGACLGIISKGIALIGLLIIIACGALFIVLAGKLYTMMSLYKGNKVTLSKALKMMIKN